MRYVLGFDGGGTKTECVLMDETGIVRALSRTGPSNPSRVSVESAIRSLIEAAEKTIEAAGISAENVLGICGGIAGAGVAKALGQMNSSLKARFPRASVMLCTDLSMTLAATGEIPSVAVIAGTGSAVFGRKSPEETARDGGFGPVLGDPGSAYDIGRKAVSLALSRDLAGKFFPLGNEIRALFQCNWVELQEKIRREPDTVFPRVFPVVAKAANDGDADAQRLLIAAAKELAVLLRNVIDRLELGNCSFFLAKTGGVFGRSRQFDETFDMATLEIAPNARIGSLPKPVAEWAAVAAIKCLDSPIVEV